MRSSDVSMYYYGKRNQEPLAQEKQRFGNVQ